MTGISTSEAVSDYNPLMVLLYHASPYPVSGDVLTPGTRNIVVNGDTARQVAYDDHAAPYLYAAGDRAEAATYAIPKGTRFGNMQGMNGRAQILFVDQELIIGDPVLQGGVHGFHSDDFIPMVNADGQPNGQWVSAKPCDLRDSSYTPIRSINDIMREGVQVYQVADAPLYDVDSFYRDIFGGTDPHAALDDAVRAGRVRWLNEERGINPVYDLARDEPKAAAPAAHPAPRPAS